MRRIYAFFFAWLLSAAAMDANSFLARDEPRAYVSIGAAFLVRLEVPKYDFAKDYCDFPAAIFRFEPDSSTYGKVASFTIRSNRQPQEILVAADGQRIVLINRNMRRGKRDDVVQIFDGHGTLLKKLELEDLFTKRDFETYWSHDDRDEGCWVDQVGLTDKNSVAFVSHGVLVKTRLHDYVLDLGTLRVSAVHQEDEPNQLPDPTSPSVTPPAGAGGAPSVAADH
jgi:hypothetical protein